MMQLKIARLFASNDRVREELFQNKPNREAVELLNKIANSFSVESHITEVETIIDNIKKMI